MVNAYPKLSISKGILLAIGTIGLVAATLSAGWGFANSSCGEACNIAFSSEYSKLAGLPVGLYTMCIWAWILSSGLRLNIIDGLIATIMAIGAGAFLFILFFILKGACPICCIHNTAAILFAGIYWKIYILNPSERAGMLATANFRQFARHGIQKAPIVCVLIASLVFLRAESAPTELMVDDKATGPSVALYLPIIGGTNKEQNRAPIENGLIISISCTHCYDALARELTKNNSSPEDLGLIFKVTKETQEPTIALVASILELHKRNLYKDIQSSYLKVLHIAYKHRVESQKGNYAPLLEELTKTVDYSKCIDTAKYILNGHTIYYTTLQTAQTPVYIRNHTPSITR